MQRRLVLLYGLSGCEPHKFGTLLDQSLNTMPLFGSRACVVTCNGCITSCWQLRSPTSSLASLGQFSTKGARSNIRRPMRWRPLLNLHLPAGPDQETTSGYKQRTSYIRTKCIAPKFRCSITSLEAASTGKAIRPLQFALLPTSMHAYALRKPAA
jgi:hypothetical protein